MINQLSKEINDNSKSKGFTHDDIPRMLCLIHSEVSEALEADRSGNYYKKRLNGRTLAFPGNIKPDTFEEYIKHTFEDELADIVIRVMDLAASKNIDLEFHIRAKMNYNATREHKHGGKKY